MNYFAYGSNMSLARLRERVPSARRIGTYTLRAHALSFHKASEDGSAKCDACHTQNPSDYVVGALFEICLSEKRYLDKVEGLGYGYNEKTVIVESNIGVEVSAATYYATKIDTALKPYSWYKNHVLVGAKESSLSEYYIQKISAVESVEDLDKEREAKQRAIYIKHAIEHPK